MAQDVLAAVSGECIHHEGSAAIHHVTVSVGIASYDDEGPCWISPSSRLRDDIKAHRGAAGLILAADRALYSAKHAGRAQAKYLDIADVDEPGDLGNLDFAYAKKRADPSSADVELTEG
jgi:GGDEF domain-containing protein